MGALYLGVDVGTSSVKLTCIDESGKVVATASEAYECSEPHPVGERSNPGYGGMSFVRRAPCLGRRSTCL